MNSDDAQAHVHVTGRVCDEIPASSIFQNLGEVSEFFKLGSLGFSPTRDESRYDALELNCDQWHTQPLDIESVESSFFEDTTLFPKGSVEFDCALLMQKIDHCWQVRDSLCCENAVLERA